MKIYLKKSIKRRPVSLGGYSYTIKAGEEVFPVDMEERGGTVLVSDRKENQIADDVFSIKKEFLDIRE